jgi:hypothetical protein
MRRIIKMEKVTFTQNDAVNLLKNIFSIEKYLQEMYFLNFEKLNTVIIDNVEYSLEYLKDLQERTNFINKKLKIIIELLELNNGGII